MRKGWEYKKLGEVGTFLRGKNILKSDFVEKGLPCIHYGQIHTKFGISTDTHLTETSQEVYNKAIIASKNDVLIAITSEDLEGSCKATAWLGDYDVAVSAHAAVFKHNLNPKYIVYYLKSQSFYIEKSKYARGFKVMEIKPTDIAKIPIPIPPKSTQLAIVSELDKINELIRLKKEQLKDFDNLAQSIFYEMFGDPVENEMGWEVKRISNIAKYHNGVAHEKDVDKDGEFILVNAKFISSEGKIRKKTNIQHFPLFRNDVVMVLSDLPNGKSLAKCFLIDEDKKYSLNQRICCFRGFEGSAIFLKYVINRNPYLLLFDNGKSQTNLRKGDVEKMPIPLPPLPLQHLFAQRIEQIEHQKAEVQKSITDLETLLASRMQYWFE